MPTAEHVERGRRHGQPQLRPVRGSALPRPRVPRGALLREPARRGHRLDGQRGLPGSPASARATPSRSLPHPGSARGRLLGRARTAKVADSLAQVRVVVLGDGAESGLAARPRAAPRARSGRQQRVDAAERVPLPRAEPDDAQPHAQQVARGGLARLDRLVDGVRSRPRDPRHQRQRAERPARSRPGGSAQPPRAQAAGQRHSRGRRSRAQRSRELALPQHVDESPGGTATGPLRQEPRAARARAQQQFALGSGPGSLRRPRQSPEPRSQPKQAHQQVGVPRHLRQALQARAAGLVVQSADENRLARVPRPRAAAAAPRAQRDQRPGRRLLRLSGQSALALALAQSHRALRGQPQRRLGRPRPVLPRREQAPAHRSASLRQLHQPARSQIEWQQPRRSTRGRPSIARFEDPRHGQQSHNRHQRRQLRRTREALGAPIGRQQIGKHISQSLRQSAGPADPQSRQQRHQAHRAGRLLAEFPPHRHSFGRQSADGDSRRLSQFALAPHAQHIRQQNIMRARQRLFRQSRGFADQKARRQLQSHRGDQRRRHPQQCGKALSEQQQDPHGGARHLHAQDQPHESDIEQQRRATLGDRRHRASTGLERSRTAAVLHRRESDPLRLHHGVASPNQRAQPHASAPAGDGPRVRDLRHGARPGGAQASSALAQVQGLCVPILEPLLRPLPLLRLRRLRLRDDLPGQLLLLSRPQLVEQRRRLLERRLPNGARAHPHGRHRALLGRQRARRPRQSSADRQAQTRDSLPKQQRHQQHKQSHLHRRRESQSPSPRVERLARDSRPRPRESGAADGALPGSQRHRRHRGRDLREDARSAGAASEPQSHRGLRPWEALVSLGTQVGLEGNFWNCDCDSVNRLRVWLAEHRSESAERMYCRDEVETVAQAIQRCNAGQAAVNVNTYASNHGLQAGSSMGNTVVRHNPAVIGGSFVPMLAGVLVAIIAVCLLVAVGFAFRQRRPTLGALALRPAPRQALDPVPRRGAGSPLRRLLLVQRARRGVRDPLPGARARAVGLGALPALSGLAADQAPGVAHTGRVGVSTHRHGFLASLPRQRVAESRVQSGSPHRAGQHSAGRETSLRDHPAGDRRPVPRPGAPAAPADLHRHRLGREALLGQAALRHARLGRARGKGHAPAQSTGYLSPGRPRGHPGSLRRGALRGGRRLGVQARADASAAPAAGGHADAARRHLEHVHLELGHGCAGAASPRAHPDSHAIDLRELGLEPDRGRGQRPRAAAAAAAASSSPAPRASPPPSPSSSAGAAVAAPAGAAAAPDRLQRAPSGRHAAAALQRQLEAQQSSVQHDTGAALRHDGTTVARQSSHVLRLSFVETRGSIAAPVKTRRTLDPERASPL
ncbi:unnamed protein product [Trichogramma brassicae]|uniref:Uncharacterized protein n=1 Tax=Trichogramma brassicae TaxID=86971 RepID=A0A6H5IAQ6_9HYME|nr:unnamed protein product [Trichogramma brassicae]